MKKVTIKNLEKLEITDDSITFYFEDGAFFGAKVLKNLFEGVVDGCINAKKELGYEEITSVEITDPKLKC